MQILENIALRKLVIEILFSNITRISIFDDLPLPCNLALQSMAYLGKDAPYLLLD